MSLIDSTKLTFNPTGNRLVPCEGPMVVPIILDFTSIQEYDLQLLLQEQQTRIRLVQTLYIDLASATAADLVVLVGPGTVNQTIQAKKGTQGYYPVLCPTPIAMNFSVGTAGDIDKVHLINVSIAGVVWTV